MIQDLGLLVYAMRRVKQHYEILDLQCIGVAQLSPESSVCTLCFRLGLLTCCCSSLSCSHKASADGRAAVQHELDKLGWAW